MCAIIGLLVAASPWIVLTILCTSISLYYLLSSNEVKMDDLVYDIGLSLNALSLGHTNAPNNQPTMHISWFSELNKLNLLTYNSSPPVVTIDTSKQIIRPPKLNFNGMLVHHSVPHNKQYYIIILSCLLSVSVLCNVMLIYWITLNT